MGSVKDSNTVKIGVHMENQPPLLTEFDQTRPLDAIIQQYLANWNIEASSQDYSLQFSGHNENYVTEKNRHEVRHGTVLVLTQSVSRTCQTILEKLKNAGPDEKRSLLSTLVKLCLDPAFAEEFITKKGKDYLVQAIERGSIKPEEGLGYALEAFVELMNHGLCSWDSLERPFVESIVNYINYGKSTDPLILVNSLAILESVLMSGTSLHSLVESQVTLPSIMEHVKQNHENPLIQQNTIALVNALLLKSDPPKRKAIAATLGSKQMRKVILENIINVTRPNDSLTSNVGTEMAHQLYILQTSLINCHEERMHLKASTNPQTEAEAREKISEFVKLAFESDQAPILDSNQRSKGLLSTSSLKSGNTVKNDFLRLGFANCKSPLEEFNETPPGMFALDLMSYFARNHTEQYRNVVLENCMRSDREHECPFAHSSMEIAKLIGEIFKIGEPPSDEGKLFYPMFFHHDHSIEEFFCICVPLLNKTWKEMKATSEDFSKVFSVLRQQLVRALADSEAVTSFAKFEKKTSSLSYSTIMNLWQKERSSREEWENKAQAILELRERIKPSIIELIKQQRLQYLTEGTRFVKYSNKGQRIKDKFWFCRLSAKFKVLHYGDCDENKLPSIDELTHKLPISDIEQMLVGKECPHMKETKNKKPTIALAFSLLYDSCKGESLNFVAPNEKDFDYWTDGINALLSKEMVSNNAQNDLETLLSMEIKLRLLDTEGITIPEKPPKVPEKPFNYDFNFIH